MNIGRRRARRIVAACEDAKEALFDVYQPQVAEDWQQFKLDKLLEALDTLIISANARNRDQIRFDGRQAYLRYVAALAGFIGREDGVIVVSDAFEEVFDLMSLIVVV